MRDSNFDPMSRGKKKEGSSLIVPIAIDPLRELGKGLGQIPLSARDILAEEEQAEEEQRRIEEEEKKKKSYESPYKELFK